MAASNLKIALTGALGSGKSRVADLFRDQGARVIDADQISRSLLEAGAKGWCALRAEFGERFFNADLTVDRKKLRAAIFGDASLRKKVDAILHPLIREEINGICAQNLADKADGRVAPARRIITVVEVPLLFEVGWQDDFDLVVVVTAATETCLERVMRRDGVDFTAAQAAFATQMSLAEKTGMADYLIDNSGTLAEAARQVKDVYARLSA